ncbi:hypothetical protein KL86SPO_31470 [uncultured Sporomusa sp.]|uniref:Uncharacterized protein n=1 Tax=uncultured Sporomusa sp. TaxID=307249 RepID=A0A212LUW3_9FIRM|nr:hypothetical protein KL86SPO_31470 [uncultured Sporomusa sp.]
MHQENIFIFLKIINPKMGLKPYLKLSLLYHNN